jgi:catechol 2,3-dioxygenase-like lactoylglutathione lyase family enzyme
MQLKVVFVAGFGPIVREQQASEAFYVSTLGLSLEREGEYLHTGQLPGVKHFALWPLSQAAESCFGMQSWPKEIPAPQAWLEFDVEDLQAATAELKEKGYTLLVEARTEPWGQVVTRLLSPEGILVGVTYTPSMRDNT